MQFGAQNFIKRFRLEFYQFNFVIGFPNDNLIAQLQFADYLAIESNPQADIMGAGADCQNGLAGEDNSPESQSVRRDRADRH